jgi:hypothetical protein
MKGASKIKQKDGSTKESERPRATTPEISARPRQSLEGASAGKDDDNDKEQQVEQLNEPLMEQERQLTPASEMCH